MDNEKLQDVSNETKNETPEEVQNQAELRDENQPEVEEEKTDGDVAAGQPQEEVEEKQPQEEVSAEEKQAEEKPVEEEKKEEASATESEEVDPHNEDDDEEEEELDFEHADKEELVSKIREIKNEENIRSLDRVLKAIKPRFDELYEVSKNEALQKFVTDGNEADAFEYHGDELDKEFITLYGQLKSKRNKHYKDLENQKEDNLKKKERILEQLREIVDGEESAESINGVRELQSEWKKVGSVPGAMNKTLWANYNALLDRYYDNRSIYFELKDLDRKKNMKLKEELCEKAEALASMEDLKTAIIQLNDLHEEYKHIGPVPKENQEPLWQRFKAASDSIYAKRKEHFEHLKEEFENNLVKKQELINEVEVFTKFTSDRITEWNGKTKEILDIQKRWEAIGGVPREKAKAINKAFWGSFKGFFANKNQFFKELESKREENLQKKQELIEKAEALKDSDDWNSTADKLKHLQTVWKDVGPVPEKVRNETYKKFKTACDHFFNRRREQNQEQFKAYEDNLKLKQQVCDQLEQEGTKENPDLDTLYDLVDNYTSIGFVPKNAIKKIRNRFDSVKEKILSNENIHEDDRTDLRNHIQMGRLKNTPGGERKLHRKEHSIKRKISTIENDISTWNTNMEFFADSATADKLKAEMQEKIDKAESELEDLRSQLAAISAQN
ncbi:DUF349 domain-containing protein [Ekhidna sp. MALMAid0563]|uniref:DUF349 domain-containing protein n=1 Tax=Ekhidna sp. MALMAid0563 TaxID=3143937 RepID=UPI0032DF35DC